MKNLSPLKAIRKNGLECSNGSAKEVRLCQVEDCSLYQFRYGNNPHRVGISGTGISSGTGKKSLVESGDFITKAKIMGKMV